MPGLIPLVLNSAAGGNHSSLGFTPDQSVPRRSSLPLPPPPLGSISSIGPLAKHLHVSLPAMVPAIPYTAADWKRVIAELKSQYINSRFRTCATQCDMILDNIKGQAAIEPAYLISLHLYAATSLEMCARPPAAPSAYHDSLYQQARAHYNQATVLVRSAEESAFLKARTSLASPSPPGLRSPSGSVSSYASAWESGFSTPALSLSSSEDLRVSLNQPSSPRTSLSPQARREVSFKLPREEIPKWEPYVRPDSPTLGLNDEYFTSARLRQSLPKTPNCSRLEQAQAPADQDTLPHGPKNRHLDDQSSPLDMDADHVRCSLLISGSTSRYCAHLASLKSQLARHRETLEVIIGITDARIGTLAAGRRAHTPTNDEVRVLERQARIERLRQSGWQRKRFNPGRYEVLRTAALAELN